MDKLAKQRQLACWRRWQLLAPLAGGRSWAGLPVLLVLVRSSSSRSSSRVLVRLEHRAAAGWVLGHWATSRFSSASTRSRCWRIIAGPGGGAVPELGPGPGLPSSCSRPAMIQPAATITVVLGESPTPGPVPAPRCRNGRLWFGLAGGQGPRAGEPGPHRALRPSDQAGVPQVTPDVELAPDVLLVPGISQPGPGLTRRSGPPFSGRRVVMPPGVPFRSCQSLSLVIGAERARSAAAGRLEAALAASARGGRDRWS